VLRRISEPKMEELRGEWRELNNVEFNVLHSLPNIE